jgi:Icc-related predicted phosphoesterase
MLSINLGSIIISASLMGITLLACIIMTTIFPKAVTPNRSVFTESTVAGRLDSETIELLAGLGNADSDVIIRALEDVRIKMGERTDDQIQKVVISVGDVQPLRRDVHYM